MAPGRQTTSNLKRFCELSPFLRLVGSEIMCRACDKSMPQLEVRYASSFESSKAPGQREVQEKGAEPSII